MKRFRWIAILAAIAFICALQAPFGWAAEPVTVELPEIILQHINGDLKFHDPSRLKVPTDTVVVSVNGITHSVLVEKGVATLSYEFSEAEVLDIVYDTESLPSLPVRPIPLWLSILPPLIAIAMAFLIKEVYSSLFLGGSRCRYYNCLLSGGARALGRFCRGFGYRGYVCFTNHF